MKLRPIASILTLGLCALIAPSAFAQEFWTAEGADASGGEFFVTERPAYRGEFFVTERPVYRGDFKPLEVPQVDRLIDQDLRREANAPDLDSAMDLSASVGRQNTFGVTAPSRL